MKHFWTCRRTSLSLVGMIILGVGLYNGTDTSMAISAICIGLSGANAYQGKGK